MLIHTTSDQASPKRRTKRQKGQIVVVFAGAAIVFIALCAVVVDISWFWANSLRAQRAVDAAALAGVVDLPGNEAGAIVLAKAEAAKNGFTDGSGGTTITAWQDPTNARRLRVTINATVGTFFARAVGINSFPLFVQAKADYVLPVPMGSPENYYGVFGTVRHPGGGVTTTNPFNNVSTGNISASAVNAGTWTNPSNVYTSNNVYATSSTANAVESWKGFTIPLNATVQNIDGVTVQVEAKISAASPSCQIAVDLSWNGGTTWTTGAGTGVKTSSNLTTTDTYYTFGSATDRWGRASWAATDFTTANNFVVRAKVIKSTTANCANATVESIDHLFAVVTYDYQTSTFTADTNLASPYGGALNPRGFWGTMLTEGAEDINGDAYSPFYDTRTSGNNPNFDPNTYYDYAVEMPAGSSNGEIWIYDPGFCAGDSDEGTGDRYFGSANTSGSNGISAYYTLYDTKNTLYDTSDDSQVASSGTFFANMNGADRSLMSSGGSYSMTNLQDCSNSAIGNDPTNPFYYHLRWWRLASGLAGGTTYRVHVTSTDVSNLNAQKNMNGQNSFAIWTQATGGSPKVHGLGAMEAYSPLQPSATSTFYLAQIGPEHAGKTMEIKLWDPGDTNGLTANLQILVPGSGGYSPATLNYTAAKGTTNTNAANCNSNTGTNVTQITTANGSTSNFNGCWVTILIPIPASYTAPTPPGETQPGWWKISYIMGSGSSSAFDLTTWQVQIRGNPVHLVLP